MKTLNLSEQELKTLLLALDGTVNLTYLDKKTRLSLAGDILHGRHVIPLLDKITSLLES